jgi:hypothetical protein
MSEAVRLSRNWRMAMGGFHPWMIEVDGGQVAGFSCRSRPFGALTVPSCWLWW